MTNVDAGFDSLSSEKLVGVDIEQARAYAHMTPEEFARSWTLEWVTSNALIPQRTEGDKEYVSSSDDEIGSVHTVTCCSPPLSPKEQLILPDDDPPPQQQKSKSSRPPRQLRPRRNIQLQPFTIERAQYKALVRRADYDELLVASPHPQQQQRSTSSTRNSSTILLPTLEQYNMTQDNDDEYEEEDVAVHEVDEEEIMTQQMHSMKMTSPQHIRTQHQQHSSVASPFGAKSLWPSASKGSTIHTYSKKRKRKPSRQLHHRRRPAPRIAEEEEDDNDDDDDANSLDSTLLAVDPLQGQGIASYHSATGSSGNEYQDDVFAFPSESPSLAMPDGHPSAKMHNRSSSMSKFPFEDVFAFPKDGPSTPLPIMSSHAKQPTTTHHPRPRKQKDNDMDDFVIDDAYDPPSRKKIRTRDYGISTKGVLPYSFVRVGHRVTEPKRIIIEDLSDDEDDRKSTGSSSNQEEEQADKEELRRSSFSSTQKAKLTTFFDHRATPRRAMSLSPPPQSRPQQHRTRAHPSSSKRNKLSLSRKNKSSRAPSLQQQQQQQNQHQHQHQRRPRRSRNNQQHGIYILPGPGGLDRHPYFTTTFRPRERSPIIFASPDNDHVLVDDTLDSHWWPGLPASVSLDSSPVLGNEMSGMALDPLSPQLQSPQYPPRLPPEDEALARFIESYQSFSIDFGALPDPCHRHGQFHGSLFLSRDLFTTGTYQVPTHVLGHDLPFVGDGTVNHDILRRLFYKCFRDLTDHLEGRRGEGLDQELELRNMVTFFYFISSSLRMPSLPHYYMKEIECFLARIRMMTETKTPATLSRWLLVMLIYAIDWFGHLPSLSSSDSSTGGMEHATMQLLKTLYQIGPDAAHIVAVQETGTVVVKDAIVVEAWISLLRRMSGETVWQQMTEWLEHEALALHEAIEKAWHWLVVLRVLLGFDKDGVWHGMEGRQPMDTWAGVPKLLHDTQRLCDRAGPLYGDYSECLSERRDRILGT